eukprot:m51a1_g3799 putative oligoendopeptidase f (604) ;mRNA; f:208300-210292
MQKTRAEIEDKFKWDLSPVYATDAAWEADFSAVTPMLEPLLRLRGHLAESAANLALSFVTSDRLSRAIGKLYTYASHRLDEDTTNTHYMGMKDRVTSLDTEVDSKTAWVRPEVFAADPAVIEQLGKAPEMAPWANALCRMLRDRPHTLSDAEETLLSQAADALEVAQKTFGMLLNADMKFPNVVNDKGETIELTKGNFIQLLQSPNRDVRRGAFEAFYDTIDKVKNTLSATLDGQVKKQVFVAKARRFGSALEASLFKDAVQTSVYTSLIDAVHAALPRFYEYIRLRAQALGIEYGKLDMWDQHVPFVSDAAMEVPWERACELVVEAVAPLGADYVALVRRAIAERWIDVYENAGKRSGAYSGGCYDSRPYVLMNFVPDIHGVFTLAHELGHSMHSYMTNHAQPHSESHYRIFVAEVASTVNEGLLLRHLLSTTKDDRLRAYLLNHKCEEFRTTVFRQTMFAEFEMLVHQMVEQGKPLTPKELNDTYYALNQLYYGPGVTCDRRIALEWSRIPHFYYDFYVYKYATSFSVAERVVSGIARGEPGALDRYMAFLRAGRTKEPLDLLADLGVDLRKPEVIVQALAEFSDNIEELSKLLASLPKST